MPSKALLAAAARGASFAEAMAWVRTAVARIAATEDAGALAGDGIDVVEGRARFTGPTTVEIDGRQLRSRRFVVATGARPIVPPLPGLREVDPLTSETLFQLPAAPPSLAILGGGPIGCEMAQAFARLGVEVTLVEALDRVLPSEEPEASAVIEAALVADGVRVRTSSPVVRVERAHHGGRRAPPRRWGPGHGRPGAGGRRPGARRPWPGPRGARRGGRRAGCGRGRGHHGHQR